MTPRRRNAIWFTFAMLLVVVAGFGLRHGTNVLQHENVRDEFKMKMPIDDIVEKGWSVDTAINYQEVKGPVFFWVYAAGAQMIGGEKNDLRLISVLFFIGGAVPLLLIALRCGVREWSLIVVAGLYVLLPYNALTSQLLFSEPTFNFFALWMMWAFVEGMHKSTSHETSPSHRLTASPSHRFALPTLLLFAVLLSILLHHRPQAVALAGAVALVAFERDGVRCWPWILACFVAGLSRIPLWLHWGGLVTSDYQGLFGFGFRLEPLTYLLAAMVPMIAIFLWPVLVETRYRSRRWWLAVGAGVGLALGVLFAPDITAEVEYEFVTADIEQAQPMYMGMVATAMKMLFAGAFMQHVAIALLAMIGGASLAAMALVTWSSSALTADGVVRRLAFWMLAAGAPLYTITSGPVYDRYLAIWIILLPAAWALSLPRGAIAVQALIAAVMAGYMINQYLM